MLLAAVAAGRLYSTYGTRQFEEDYPVFIFAACLLGAFWFIGSLVKFGAAEVLHAMALQLLATVLIPVCVAAAGIVIWGVGKALIAIGTFIAEAFIIPVLGTIAVIVIAAVTLTGVSPSDIATLYVFHNIFKDDD